MITSTRDTEANKMETINKSTTNNTATYYWDAKSELFTTFDDTRLSFQPTHKIIVDADLYADELDAIFVEVI